MIKRFAVVLVLGVLGAAGVRAEGFRLYGMSAEGQMRGEALVASAQGPDANWYNPAALVTMPLGSAVSAGLNYLVVKAEYTSNTGQSAKNNETNFPLPSLYYSQKISDDFAFGVGVNTPFGLSTDYEDNASFSYITTGGEVKLINLSPNIAVRVNDQVSWGIGINYYRSSIELRQIAPYSLAAGTDSPVKIQGEGEGVGVNTGFLVKLSETQRVGLTYKSEATIDYDGKSAHVDNVPVFNVPYETGVKTRITFPGMVGFGYGFEPSDRWQIEIGGQWTNWQVLNKVDVQFDEQTFLQNKTVPFDWKDSWTGRVGGTYRVNDAWKLSGGYFYTTSPTRESTYTPLVPDGNHHVFSVGGQYAHGRLSIGIPAVLILQSGRSTIQNNVSEGYGVQNVNGNYDLLAFQLGLSAGWKF